MVEGFKGDNEDWLSASTCLFLITNYFMFQVLVEFLRQRWTWFDQMRTDIIKSRVKILICSIFDILLSVMPIVYVISDYENGPKYIMYTLVFTMMLLAVHYIDGSHKKSPIISNWFIGENHARRLYEIISTGDSLEPSKQKSNVIVGILIP